MLIEDKILFMKTAPKAQGKADLPLDRQELNETGSLKVGSKKTCFYCCTSRLPCDARNRIFDEIPVMKPPCLRRRVIAPGDKCSR